MPSLRSRLYYQISRFTLARLRARNLSLPDLRADRERIASRMFRLPQGVAARPCTIGGCPAEWLVPQGFSAGTAVLHLHGGAYQTGSLATHRALAARLALESGSAVLLFEYRLAPEHPCPAALDDALRVCRDLLADGEFSRIAFAGDSAGGGLALALAIALRDAGEPLPAGLALLSPWTDLALTGATHRSKARLDPYFPTPDILDVAAQRYAGADRCNPLVSPLYADLSGLPPMLLHVGTHETLLDDSVMLADRARAAGAPIEIRVWPGMWHVWQVFSGRMPEADRSLAELGAFLRQRLEISTRS
ncbi:alpha/beta hydrolase [Mesorhizobium amorphae]